MIDVESRLSRAILQLQDSCPEVNAYVAARRSDFVPVERSLRLSGGNPISAIVLRRGTVEQTISGTSPEFHHCALSHLFTSRALLLPEELSDDPIPDDHRTP